MNIYEFMSGSPWLTFFLAVLAGELIFSICKLFICKKNNQKDLTEVIIYANI